MKVRPTFGDDSKRIVIEKMSRDICDSKGYDYNEVLEILTEELPYDDVLWDTAIPVDFKEIKDANKSIDIDLLNIVGSIGYYKAIVLESLIAEWAENIEAELAEGDLFKATVDNVEYVGEVIAVILNQAQYLTFIEELGHVKGSGDGIKGVLVNYEDAKPISVSIGFNDEKTDV